MRKFHYLINYEISVIIKKALVIAALLFLTEFIAFMFIVTNEKNAYLRFEELAEMSGYHIIFSISLFAILGLIAYSFYKNWLESKSIYTLMCLPLARWYVYISKLVAAAISIGLLAAVQIINIFFSYGVYLSVLPQIPKVKNGLLLAFLRWDFFKLFYPSEFTTAIIPLAYALMAVTAVIFAVAAERAAKYSAIAFALISALLIIVLPFGNMFRLLLITVYTIICCNRTISLIKSGSIT